MAKQKWILCSGKCGMEYKEKVLVNGRCPECELDRKIEEEKAKELFDKSMLELNSLLSSTGFLNAGRLEARIEMIVQVPIPYPQNRPKPRYNGDGTAKSYASYAEDLAAWEIWHQEYLIKEKKYDEDKNKREQWFRIWAIKECLPEFIPEWQKRKVFYKAWELGHSSGYHEVYNYLIGLAEIFYNN